MTDTGVPREYVPSRARRRVPLRPLARILKARDQGDDPDAIERANIRARQEETRNGMRQSSERRLLLAAFLTVSAFGLVGLRMWSIAAEPAREPVAQSSQSEILAARADIVDRRGRVLATNLVTQSLYAQPHLMTDPVKSATDLVRIFPDLKLERLLKDFTGGRKFLWVKRRISPEQRQQVHDIGDPGLQFGPRDMRLYPNGALAAHILGGTKFGTEGVHSAEIVGVAGVEKAFDSYLRDPSQDGRPLQLSIDLTLQAVIEEVLAGGMTVMNAQSASAVLMDIYSGEILTMASLPEFDPNDRPPPPTQGDPSAHPIFNQSVQGLYELGSTMKIFGVAQALELGLVNPDTMIPTQGPLRAGGFNIKDFKDLGPSQTVTNVIVKSSNIGTARIAQQIGAPRQQEFLKALGFLDPSPVELIEAPGVHPLYPKNWSELSAMTISYGHGLSISPLQLASGYASILNGGTVVTPTILRQTSSQPGPRIVSQEVSATMREMLRLVVDSDDGTASFARLPGYSIGGKTGSADKPRPSGGYYDDKVIGSFASVFPTDQPKYILVVMLDEAEIMALGEERRTAGWTTVPISHEITRRILPLLGLRPSIEYAGDPEINPN